MRSSRTCFGKHVSSRNMRAAQGAGCSKENTEFVNHGLILWNQSRQKWVGNETRTSQSQLLRMLKLRKIRLCCINSSKGKHKLLNSSKTFPRPIPLEEMVDFLVNVWDDEGMYEMV